MKKILAILLAAVLCMMNVYAEAATSGNQISGLGTPQQTVKLSLDEGMDWFSFGFATAPDKTSSSTETVLKLSEGNSGIADNSGSDLYVWWDITTDSKFNVAISMDGPLKNSSSSEIGWTVSRSADDETDLGNVAEIGLDSGGTLRNEFLESETDGFMHTYSGMQKLYIATKAGELEGKPVGSGNVYTNTLTLTITDESSAS